MSFVLNSILLIICLSFTSCSKPNTKGFDVRLIETRTLQTYSTEAQSSQRLQSQIRLQADDLLLNSEDSLSVDISYNILDEDSVLNLVAFTTDMNTKTGTVVEFKKVENALEISVYLQDYPKFHLCHIENIISSNSEVKLKVQLLNSNALGPVLTVWNKSDLFSENRKRNNHYTNINTADCSTLRNNVPISFFGMGNLWGLELYKTKLNYLRRTESYVL